MKRKLYKVLSIILTVALVFSCCAVSLNVSAATATHTHNGSNWDGVFHAQITGNGTQGMASYNGYYFWASPQGTVAVYNVADTGKEVAPIATFKLGSYNSGSFPKNFDTEGTQPSWWANHSNQMMFGTEKFSKNDEFPLLYVTTGSSTAHDGSGAYIAKCAVERIIRNGDTWSSETVQIIEFNDFANIPKEEENPYKNQNIDKTEIPYNYLPNMYNKKTGRFNYVSGNGYYASEGYEKIGCGWPAWLVDVKPTEATEGKIYLYSTRFTSAVGYEQLQRDAYGLDDKKDFSEYNAHIITEFDLPEVPTSKSDPNYGKTVTLYPKDITDQFNTEYKTIINQGGVLYNGKLYWTYGGDVNSSRFQIFDIGNKSLNALYNLSRLCTGEPESCFIYNDEIYVGRYNLQNRQVIRLSMFMEDIAATDATCRNSGTVAHARCNLCDKYFSIEDYSTVLSSIKDTSKPADGVSHIYNNCEDADCNDCGSVRTVSGHKYSNACDARCNVCDKIRKPSSHKYTNAADKTCNVCSEVREVADCFIKKSGVYYFYKNGVKSSATGLVKVNGKWFYITKGKWDTSFTGLFKKNGKWLYVEKGRWSTKTDLVKFSGKWFYVKAGKWDSSVNTLFKKSGKFFAIKSGKWEYKGKFIVAYKGKKFYCNKGYAQLGFSGKVKIGSKTYTVKKGQII